MPLEPGDAVDPGPAADIEQAARLGQREPAGQHRRDVLGTPRQRERQVPGRRLALHRRFDPLAIDERRARLVGRGSGRAVRPEPLDHLEHAGAVGGQADVAADVELAAGYQVFPRQLG